MVPIGLESLLEHFIFLNFLGGGPPNPPNGEGATAPPPYLPPDTPAASRLALRAIHEMSLNIISNPPIENPIYTHVIAMINLKCSSHLERRKVAKYSVKHNPSEELLTWNEPLRHYHVQPYHPSSMGYYKYLARI